MWYANEEQDHLEKLQKAGVIEPSCSEWASPSVLVRKRDGSVRWCIDIRKLNDVTVKDCYPLPLLQDCIDAPATFSRSVSLVLRGLSGKSVIAFLDDVVVLGRDFDSHMVNLSDVLRRFEQYGMKLKPKKCHNLQDSVVFLGRLVSREGVQVPPVEITRIGNWGCTVVQARCSVFYWCPKFPYGSYSKVCIGGKTLV